MNTPAEEDTRVDEASLAALSAQLGEALAGLGKRLAVAESCTGGWIAKLITDVPGSSAWFDRGFVTYSNAAKQDMLGVSAQTLRMQGAVSEATVRAMAQGVIAHSLADIAAAVSGIAGPGGGSAQRPVGTVWIAWAQRTNEVQAQCFQFEGDREAVRRQAVREALRGLLRRVRG